MTYHLGIKRGSNINWFSKTNKTYINVHTNLLYITKLKIVYLRLLKLTPGVAWKEYLICVRTDEMMKYSSCKAHYTRRITTCLIDMKTSYFISNLNIQANKGNFKSNSTQNSTQNLARLN